MTQPEDQPDPQLRSADPGQQDEQLRVARIGKPHGVRGEVTVQLFTDDPAGRLAPGSTVIRRPGPATEDTTTTAVTVASQRWNKNICLVGFEEVGDRSAAEALRGSLLYVVPAEEEQEDHEGSEGWYSYELEGLRCLDAGGGLLGEVAELLPAEAQDLLLVTTPAGEEVLVPFVEELVPEIDVQASTIRLDPPPGLFPAVEGES